MAMSYTKFFLTLFVSLVIMYVVMFLNIDSFSHYHTSLTRIYMSLLMVTPMAIVMILMMGKMYSNKNKNRLIISGSITLFIIVLFALRSQTPIADVQYMKAMIPHHSSAIMVSKNAKLTDPEVKKLASQIIESQEREIKEMESLIKRLHGQ
jgi:uncharacterized protein (DUF305 family)